MKQEIFKSPFDFMHFANYIHYVHSEMDRLHHDSSSQYEKYNKQHEKSFFDAANILGIRLHWQKHFEQDNSSNQNFLFIKPDFYYDFGNDIKIAIECDGEHHNWHNQQPKDDTRDCQLNRYNIHVIRFHNRVIEEELAECISLLLKESYRIRLGNILKPTNKRIYSSEALNNDLN